MPRRTFLAIASAVAGSGAAPIVRAPHEPQAAEPRSDT